MRRWLVLTLCSGCGVILDEGDFLDRYPENMCNRAIACLWQDVPQDLQDCEDERRAVLEDYSDRGCTYDGSAAGECMRDLQSVSCEETQYRFADALPGQCAYVYTCTTTTGPTTSYTY